MTKKSKRYIKLILLEKTDDIFNGTDKSKFINKNSKDYLASKKKEKS